MRLYLGFPLDRRRFLSGPDGPRRFMDSFRFASVPGSAVLADATPTSPCMTYPNEDTWCDEPYGEGVVLIGDAAGWNDPIIGQGLSVTMRDIRVVSELLCEQDAWTPPNLAPYGSCSRRSQFLTVLAFGAGFAFEAFGTFGAFAAFATVVGVDPGPGGANPPAIVGGAAIAGAAAGTARATVTTVTGTGTAPTANGTGTIVTGGAIEYGYGPPVAGTDTTIERSSRPSPPIAVATDTSAWKSVLSTRLRHSCELTVGSDAPPKRVQPADCSWVEND